MKNRMIKLTESFIKEDKEFPSYEEMMMAQRKAEEEYAFQIKMMACAVTGEDLVVVHKDGECETITHDEIVRRIKKIKEALDAERKEI